LQYEYHLKDHTGNTVTAIADLDGDGNFDKYNEILQLTHYYPFGMVMNGLYTPAIGTQNNYKYGSKELQDEFGLNELDFGTRFYDPAIARWAQLDPMAEGASDWTPYRYAFNNPMSYSDPSGMFEMPKGQFPDYFDPGCGLHLPGQGSGSGYWGGFGGGLGGNYHYDSSGHIWGSNGYDTWGAGHYSDSGGISYNWGTKTYQKDGEDISYEEVNKYLDTEGNTKWHYERDKWTPSAPGVAEGVKFVIMVDRINRPVEQGENGEIVEHAAEAVGLGADVNMIFLSGGKFLVNESGTIFKGFTATGTVVGAIAGGVPALYNIFTKKGGDWKDWGALGLSVAGVFSEFIGVGEVWDAVAVPIAVASTTLDIYNIATKKK
jgi:RHS repeat-associated protein